MKNSETEREITDLIKSALDNYQEDYIPGAWENFVSIRKRKRRVIVLRIVSGIAACLLAGLIGSDFLGFNFNVKTDTPIVKNNQIQPIVRKDTQKAELPLQIKPDPIAVNRISDRRVFNHDYKSSIADIKSNDPGNGKDFAALITIPDLKKAAEKDTNVIQSVADSLKTFQSLTYRTVDSLASKAASKQSKFPEYKSVTEPDLLQKLAANKVQNPEKRKIRIGINFSPGVNSSQSGSSFNYSGGLSTDIALFSDFLLSTGLQLEHQSVVNSGNASSSFSALQTKADLLNLDLPINITWKFFSGKSKSYYISTGISSMAYLSEKYDKTSYSRQLVEVQSFSDRFAAASYKIQDFKSTAQNTEPSFNTIDIAGRINILFGVEQRLSPKLYLHLEPYLKIPVSGLATEHLRFSTSGVTCKVSF